ncbi:ABC transporter permease [Pseudonocardia hispaniensis]|uniref:ABC transporter permease n=1 Tax=Pseudonocardia hispaniensis TaxID=904933 RepID=A0ABW1IYT7_9PSEU
MTVDNSAVSAAAAPHGARTGGAGGGRPPAPATAAGRWRGLRGLGYRYGVLVVWAVEIVIFSILAPQTFPTVANATSILNAQAALLVLALAVVPTLAAGEYDLSAAATMTLSATIAGQLSGVSGWNLWLAVLLGLLAAVAVGLLNAFLAVRVGVQSIVVTLGMGTLLVGLSVWFSNSMTIGGVPRELGAVMNTQLLGVNAAVYYALLIGAVLWFVHRHTPLGRHVLFVGQNREVARLSGVPVARIRTLCFVTTSLLSGIAGIMVIGIAGGLQPTSLQSLLLPAFAAAFLGSAIFEPGRVNPLGTIVAVLFLATGITGLVLLGLEGWIRDVFYGAAVVLAVTVSRLAFLRTQRRTVL